MKLSSLHVRRIITVFILGGIFLLGMGAGVAFRGDSITADTTPLIFPQASAQGRYSQGLPDVVEKVVPAIVNISSKKVVKIGGDISSPFFSDPFFRHFFGDDFFRRFNVPKEDIQKTLGSGVIVSEEGYILTNNHLVEQAEEVVVVLPDERKYDARVVGTDPESDVAVLKIDAEELPTVPFGDSDKLRLGEVVLAIGYPFNIGQTVTMGIVSALGRGNLQLVNYGDFIQTDAAINPGNSGGALINERGELIGINTAIYTRSGGYQGIGFAIPIKMAYAVMESIVQEGRVVRGWLGVLPADVDPILAEGLDLGEVKGVILTQIIEDSPAEKGGLKRDDVVLKYNGEDVGNRDEFRNMVAATKPGERAVLEILRDGKVMELKVEVGERQGEQEVRGEEEKEESISPLFTGVRVDDLTDYYRRRLNLPSRLEGVIVTGVQRGSKAEEAGLREGDVIVEVNKRKVNDLDDFKKTLEKSKKDIVILYVYRAGNKFYIYW